jgi:serine protease Do
MSRTMIVLALAMVLVFGLALLAASPAPPASPTPPTPRATRAPAPPPDPDDPVFFFSAGGSWLGVQIADISGERAKELGLKEEMGAEIKAVLPGSPAAEAGLKEGDVILEYAGSRLLGVAQLTRMVHETPSGRTIRLKVFRDGATRDVPVTMKERKGRGPGGRGSRRIGVPHIEVPDIDVEIPDLDIPEIPGPPFAPSFPRLGARVEDLGDQLGEYFGVKNGDGVLVRSVRKGGPAESAGLRAGDVIVKVDEEAVADPSDLRGALRERRDAPLTLTVVRDRKEITLKVAPPKSGHRRGDDEEDPEGSRDPA